MAAERTLCSGFSGCASKGKGSAGYDKVYTRSHWGQLAGHNCTNYVAYRMGLNDAAKPVSGPMGDAKNWGHLLAKYRNTTPAVGAIAWWDESAGKGSDGHVAYVEQVLANGTVVVSEDNWRGDFHWKEYSKGDRYPTGFIHYSLGQYRNSIVKGTGDSVTSWLVGNDLKRYWVPDGGTYLCLQEQGVRGPFALPAVTLARLTDQTDKWANCGNSDINWDGRVDIVDLSILLADWGTSNPRSDVNRDRDVDIVDLSILLSDWGRNPRPATAHSTFGAFAATPGTGSPRLLPTSGGDAEVIAQASSGELFGNSSAEPDGAPTAAVWTSVGSAPIHITVSGVSHPVLVDANRSGLSVGAGQRDSGGDAAWYRTPGGTTGELDPDGAERAFALSVDDGGQIAGYVFKGKALPVVWETTTSAPTYLPLPPGVEAGVITAMNGKGLVSGSLVDDRLAVWAVGGSLRAPVTDGEATDINDAGAILFNSASTNTAHPKVRRPDGSVHSLGQLPGYEGQMQQGLALTRHGHVGGFQGRWPVVWLAGGKTARQLTLPSGSQQGRVLGLLDSGHAFGWVEAAGIRRAAIWTNVNLAIPQPPPPSTSPPLRQATVKVKTPKQAKLRIDVNPDLRGKKAWKVKVLKKEKAKFVRVRALRTSGPREIARIDVPRGRYKVRVPSQHGYRGATSAVVRVKR